MKEEARRAVIFEQRPDEGLNKDTVSVLLGDISRVHMVQTLSSNEDTSQTIYCEYRPQSEMEFEQP